MLIKVERMTGEVARTDHVYVISRVRLHRDRNVLSSVHEGASWRRRPIGGYTIGGLVGMDEVWHLLMVPIEEGERNFLIEMKRRVRVMDNERSKKPIWVLTHVV